MIRPADADDDGAIRTVHLQAFPSAAEADLAERLRRDGDVAVSLVAIEHGQVVGHLLLSRMEVEGDRRSLSALGLGPVAVVPQRQRQGIGSALIEAAIDEGRALGTDIIFVLGSPDYYGRFGFSSAAAAPFASPYAGEYFQALVLAGGLPAPRTARAEYAPAFAELG